MNGAAIQPSPGPFYTVLVLYLGIMAFIGWYAGRYDDGCNPGFLDDRNSDCNFYCFYCNGRRLWQYQSYTSEYE